MGTREENDEESLQRKESLGIVITKGRTLGMFSAVSLSLVILHIFASPLASPSRRSKSAL